MLPGSTGHFFLLIEDDLGSISSCARFFNGEIIGELKALLQAAWTINELIPGGAQARLGLTWLIDDDAGMAICEAKLLRSF